MSASNATFRRWVLTLGVTAITVSGAYFGANLGVEQDKRKEIRKAREADVGEQIKSLEVHRSRLMAQKTELQKKLEEVRRRPRKDVDGP